MIFPEIKETPGTPPRYYFEAEEFEGILLVDSIGSGDWRDLIGQINKSKADHGLPN